MIEYIQSLNQLKESLIQKESNYSFLKKINLPFIPDFNANFNASKNRVVVVGQETGKWGTKNLDAFVLGDLTAENLVAESKARYNKYYRKTPTDSIFLRFMNKIIQNNHDEDVQWLNFYICAYENASFNQLNKKKNNINLYREMTDFSMINLTNQLNFLKPRNIFFLGQYHNNWPKLKNTYINEEEILNLKKPIRGFGLRFWNKNILVIRALHPNAKVEKKGEIHQKALDYFRIFNEEANQDSNRFKQIIASDLVL